MHHCSILHIATILTCISYFVLFTLVASLSIFYHCVTVVSASVGGVGRCHRLFLHSPSSLLFLIFLGPQFLDLGCCGCHNGHHGWGRSSMLVLLGLVLDFDGNDFGGYYS